MFEQPEGSVDLDRYMALSDLLCGLADELASVTLRSQPVFPEGQWGDVRYGGMLRQPDGSYEGDPQDN